MVAALDTNICSHSPPTERIPGGPARRRAGRRADRHASRVLLNANRVTGPLTAPNNPPLAAASERGPHVGDRPSIPSTGRSPASPAPVEQSEHVVGADDLAEQREDPLQAVGVAGRVDVGA